MQRADIERYLHARLGHSVIVDVREVEDAPGNVRTVTIHRDYKVTIEYETSKSYAEGESEGGGLKYIGQYLSLDDLIVDLEEYLEAKMQQWRNFTSEPLSPASLDDPDSVKSQQYFEDLVRRRAVPLPRGVSYKLAGVYWRHISKYGEYRQDKLLEEQEDELEGPEE